MMRKHRMFKIYRWIIILSSISFIASGIGIGNAEEVSPPENAANLNNQLLHQLRAYQEVPAVEKDKALENLTKVARKRKYFFLKESSRNPRNFLLHSLPEQIAKQLPAPVQDLIEKKLEVKGVLHIFIADNFATATSRRFDVLESMDAKTLHKKYNLHYAEQPPSLLSGSVVIARGIALEKELVLASGDKPHLETVSAAASPAVGEQKTIVMMVNFLNDTSQPVSAEQIRTALFTDPKSTNLYYQDNSYGLTSFTGDVVGWYTIPYNNDGNCDTYRTTWANAADAAASNAGVNLSNYNRKVYFLRSPNCPWAGYATLGGSPSRAWIFGYNDARLYAHELGHNLGLHHASTIKCGAKAIDSYGNCTITEYGDIYDTMGSWNLYHYNSAHKAMATYVPFSQIQSVTADGSYEVYPLEPNSSNIKALKIRKPNTSQYYYVSYRQPIGFDSTLPTGITRGGSIHIDYGSAKTLFIDTTPATSGFSDAALSDGAGFEDTINGITITQASHSTNSAIFSVKFGPVVCTKNAPILSVSPLSQTGSSGQTLNYSVSVKNNDTSVCADTTFNLSSILPSGWIATFSPADLTLSPGTSASSTWQVTSALTAADGSYNITAKATDSAESTHTGSVNATYIVFTDTIAPAVSIISPADGAKVKGNVKINISASDNYAVSKVELYIDSLLSKTFTALPYSYNWNTRKVTSGSHTITAKAYDAAGNVGTSSITVYK